MKRVVAKILIAMVIISIIIMTSSNVFALKPRDINGAGEDTPLPTTLVQNITDVVSKVGTFIAVGVLMIIGIRYMMGSMEERATYKKSMLPYVIGCFILFGAAYLAPAISDLFVNMGDTAEDIGNKILGIIQVVGTLISVGALMIMGIKYMAGSMEQKAAYKKSMLPLVIGAVLLFAAVNIVVIISRIAPQ